MSALTVSTLKQIKTKWLMLLLIALVATLVAEALANHTILRQIERWTEDLRIAAFTPHQPQHPSIRLITITEQTLALLPYRSPVNRKFLAKLIDILNAKGVRKIGIDILVDQATEPEADRQLRQSLARSKVPTVLAYITSSRLTEAQQAFLDTFTGDFLRGHINLPADAADGVVRYLPMPKTTPAGAPLPSFTGVLAEQQGVELPRSQHRLVYRGWPEDTGERGVRAAFASYPAHTVAFLPREWLADSIVLIGADLPEAEQDMQKTPFVALQGSIKGQLPGVMIHAHALAQLLEDERLPQLEQGSYILTLGLAALLGLLFARLELGLLLMGILMVVTLSGYAAASCWLFAAGGPLIPLLAPIMALLITVWAAGMWLGQQERQQRRFIKQAFSHYLAPTLVEQLLADPRQLTLRGERRELTLLFTDIAGFTTLAEQLPPAALVRVMSRYLDGMTRIVLEHGGTIDKYIGDAMMVLFGAPLTQSDHAQRAVQCAIALDRFAENLRLQLRQADDEALELGITRIGIHTGEAVVGNFGSDLRFDYTAMGDAVNTASRLEGLNRYFGTRIALSGVTAAQVAAIPTRPLAEVVVKGKTQPLQVVTPAQDDPQELCDRYLQAYQWLVANDTRAEQAFAQLCGDYPDDPVIHFHWRRLQSGQQGPIVRLEGK